MHRVVAGQCRGHQGVATLVVGGDPLLLVVHDPGALLRAGDHAVDRLVECPVVDQGGTGTGGQQGGLVEHVGQVGAGEAGRAPGDCLQVDAGGHRLAAGVDLEHLRGARGGPAGTTWICRSKRPGRSSAGSRMSGRLVAAIRMTPPETSKPSISTSSWLRVCSRSSCPPPSPAPRWRPTASISSTKMIAGALALACSKRSRTRRGADADEHLDEVRAGDGEERDAGLTGHGAGQQGLAGAGRAVEQHALGDLGAHGLEPGRVLEELLDLLELLDGLVGAGDVGEGGLGQVLAQRLGLGLAEAHDLRAAAHLVHEEEQQPEDEEDRQQRDQHRHEERLARDLDVVGLEGALVHLGLHALLELHALAVDVLGELLGPVGVLGLDALVDVDEQGGLDLAVVQGGHHLGGVHLARAGDVADQAAADQQQQSGDQDPEDRTT